MVDKRIPDKRFPDLLPCVICGQMAKTIRDKNGNPIQAGCHTECMEKEQMKVERRYREEMSGGDNN